MTMFNEAQVKQLLAPIRPNRVLQANGQSHVSQQDVRAHLTRVFGFGHWSKEVLRLEVVSFVEDSGRSTASYLCHLRLTVWNADRSQSWSTEDVATGSAQRQKTPGDAHDLAAKAAVSYALKRCATDLGDQFGLSLYNKGQMAALVVGTLVLPTPSMKAAGTPADADVQEGVPDQVSLGNDDAGSSEAPAEPERPAQQAAKSNVPEVPCRACGEVMPATHVRAGRCKPCTDAGRPVKGRARSGGPSAPATPAEAPGGAPGPDGGAAWPPVAQPGGGAPDHDPSYHDGAG